MKIIHVADLHLDSKLSANLPEGKRKIRKNEVLLSFSRLAQYAAENEVSAVLIAGDLFDGAVVSRIARDSVLAAVKSAPKVQFYYLRGNHDEGGALGSNLSGESVNRTGEIRGNERSNENGDIPANLHLFGSSWTSYNLEPSGSVVLYGAELGKFSGVAAVASLVTDQSKTNIVMLHGQEAATAAGPCDIPIKDFKNKGIDYLALGHVHFHKEEALDGRGTYAYPGILEGRGFDECGEHGFILLNINLQTKALTHTFIPFANRKLYEVNTDVTGTCSTSEALYTVKNVITNLGCEPESLLKVVLTGEVPTEASFDTSYITTALEQNFFFVKTVDKTTLKINYEDYAGDISLRGEFVRRVQSSDLSEKEKAEVIRCGIRALSGEEVFA